MKGVGRHIWDVPLAWIPDFLKVRESLISCTSSLPPLPLLSVLSCFFFGIDGREMQVGATLIYGIAQLSEVGATTIEPSILFTKLSLLLLFYRIFSPHAAVK